MKFSGAQVQNLYMKIILKLQNIQNISQNNYKTSWTKLQKS
jgi:hypothetical protein